MRRDPPAQTLNRAGLDSREDAYLVHPVLRGLSVKIRAGQLLEVKQYHGSPGILDAAGRARGRIECWRKWSFPFGPLGPDDAGPPGWTVVYKRRRMSRFRLAGGQLVADVAERATGPECGVERVTAAIHPQEGEESPARRRKNQNPSHDQRQ